MLMGRNQIFLKLYEVHYQYLFTNNFHSGTTDTRLVLLRIWSSKAADSEFKLLLFKTLVPNILRLNTTSQGTTVLTPLNLALKTPSTLSISFAR